MRIRGIALLIAFALSFHAEIAWAGGTDCVEMGSAAAESAAPTHAHGESGSHGDDSHGAPECPTPIHHIAACSPMGIAASVSLTSADDHAGRDPVFGPNRLLDRLPASLPSPPPWV